jgi:hypothetical protein
MDYVAYQIFSAHLFRFRRSDPSIVLSIVMASDHLVVGHFTLKFCRCAAMRRLLLWKETSRNYVQDMDW